MKFSWRILNYFIDLEKIKFEEFTKKLILSGFEIERIDEKTENKDTLIDLDITANRKDINCIFNLAKEISIILNLPIKPLIVYKNFNYLKKTNDLKSNINRIQSIYINTIHKIINSNSPIWLKKHLKTYDIKSLSLLSDIKQYIKIKWGHNIIVYDLDKLNIKNIDHKLITLYADSSVKQKIILSYKKQKLTYFDKSKDDIKKSFNDKSKNILLCFFTYENNTENLLETINNAYHETIQLITTFGAGIINKPYKKLYYNSYIKKIKIKHHKIKKILGPTNYKNNKLISHKEIINRLNQLKLKYQYYPLSKISELTISENRQYDLSRPIDIIEELARIHGYEKFLNKIPSYIKKGRISKKLFYTNKIRNILKNLGLNEVVNTSLVNKEYHNKYQISVHNPLTLEIQSLRTNIINNLIQNYKYNKKQKNLRTEIFEIGKIFYKDKNHKYIEETQLTGLISNSSFIRKDWTDISNNPNIFHIKGILEIFFYQLNAKIEWNNLKIQDQSENLNNLNRFINSYQRIGIYSCEKSELLGFLSKLNPKYLSDISEDIVYLFSISIDKLLKVVYLNKHLKYTIKNYSTYPSVTRDISFNITKNITIDSIKKLILEKHNENIESINIVNEYYNINKKSKKIAKSVCFRIIYRSNIKTLDNKDIEKIDMNIKKILD